MVNLVTSGKDEYMMSMFPTRRGPRGFGRDLFNGDNDFFDSFFSDVTPIKTDIRETEEAYILDAELPGFSKEDIDIEYDNNVLTISANVESGMEESDEEGTYIRRERSTRSFSRQFIVENIKSDEISASFENGVLTIDLPKSEPDSQESKRIEIN